MTRPSAQPRTISVVIATRGRPEQLRRCLRSLTTQTRAPDRIVIVENVSDDAATREVVDQARAAGLPCVLTREPQPGLGRAHNRGLPLCPEGIVAITDDDVVTDPEWLEQILAAFGADLSVGAVTGKILPLRLDTPAQELTERYARYDKGREVRRFSLSAPPEDPLFPLATGAIGSGANMSFRSEALHAIGGFDPALGAGTRAKGGDDLAAMLDVLMDGWSVTYTPHAKVSHEHPRTLDELERQISGYGTGLGAYLTRSMFRHPSLILPALRSAPAGLRHALSADSPKNAGKGPGFPSAATRKERLGMLTGPASYARSVISSRPRRPRARDEHPPGPYRRMPIPVLLYHGVSDRCAPNFRRWNVTPQELAEQIAVLQERGLRGVGVTELLHEARAAGGPPAGLIGITFDDAFADVAENALPALRDAGFGATIFVPTAFVGGRAEWLAHEDEGQRAIMDWAQLERALGDGFEIGAHSHRHPELDTLGREELRCEVETSAGAIERELGVRPTAFAYPHGYYDVRCRRAVRSAGFAVGCGVGHAWTSLEDDPLAHSRIIVSGGLQTDAFSSLLEPPGPRGAAHRRKRPLRRWAWRSARRMRAGRLRRGR
jgi:peptidoglycan/xylan/chitin deacetylase (PgdA/CDA1 family)/GT2 family glycosyltransferase